MLPRVTEEIERVKREYPAVEVKLQPDGSIQVEVGPVPLPEGWSKKATRILVVLPPQYPQAKPSSFFADSNLLHNGKNPRGSSQTQVGDGNWTSFCWNPEKWDLSKEDLWKYIKFCESRFKESG